MWLKLITYKDSPVGTEKKKESPRSGQIVFRTRVVTGASRGRIQIAPRASVGKVFLKCVQHRNIKLIGLSA